MQSTIAELSKNEANRRRVRDDDLRIVTEKLLNELISSAPQLSYVKPRLQESIVNIDFNPKDPASSNSLLHDLQARLVNIAENERKSGIASSSAGDRSPVEYEIIPKSTDVPPTHHAPERDGRSMELLDELSRRVAERENPRK